MARDTVGSTRRLDDLGERLASHGSAQMLCDAQQARAWLATELASADEGWVAARDLERCATALGNRVQLAMAKIEAARSVDAGGGGAVEATQRVRAELQSALDTLGAQGFRYQRSLVLFELGQVLQRAGHVDEAIARYEEALAIDRNLSWRAGIATMQIAIARAQLQRGAPQAALQLLDEARALLADADEGFRLIEVQRSRIDAYAALRSPEVLAAIDDARVLDTDSVVPARRARLAQSMAAGYASLGRWEAAYGEMQRSNALANEARSLARNQQVLYLQARYESARRDAEIAALRHDNERSVLLVNEHRARQRALLALLAFSVLLLVLGGAIGWRVVQRRNQLAALALRDELTGLPNRRAVLAYGKAQLEQSQQLGIDFSVALIDLDHFKRINDTRGHAYGDAVLRAFAQSAVHALRGQDYLGRFGGEEWLLVLPGTRADELQSVFERMREQFAATRIEGDDDPHAWRFSMGGAQAGVQERNLDALIERADAALYRAKEDGRDRLCVTAPGSTGG